MIQITEPTRRPPYPSTTSKADALKERHTMDFKINEGTVDRALRIVAGLALIALALVGTIGAWGYIGIILLLTGAVGMCPIYSLLGLSTRPRKQE